MKTRQEIDEQYKWDLSCFVKDEDELKQNLKYLKDNAPKFREFYGKLGDVAEYKKYHNLALEYNDVLGKTAMYLYRTLDTDTSSTKFLNYNQQFDYIMKDYSEATAYINPQMLDLPEEYYYQILQEPEFKDYKRGFECLIKNKPHKISEHDSELFSKMSLFLGGTDEAYSTLTNGEIQFKNAVDSNGKELEVIEAEYIKLLTNKDRKVRETAFKSLMQGYGDKIKTLACMYTKHVQEESFYAKHAKFNSVFESCMFYEEVEHEVYNTLIKNINSRLNVLHKILEIKGKYLGIQDLAYYDIMLDVGQSDEKYSVEQAVELVKNCTKILGEEYQDILDEKFKQKVIDYLPNKDKQSGAYSSGIYNCPSVVLMNFVDNYESVSTLAHEIGHAMHTELSNRNQPLPLADYVIFVAEVASTVNEILLNLLVRKNASESDKVSLIFRLLNDVRSTIYRQTMFSEFEQFSHSVLENGQPLTYEDLNNKYYELSRRYFGDKLILPDELKYEWSRIPHFYNDFYVYKYATGYISALCIVQKLLDDKNYYKQYINFLKGGCTKSPVELLKDIGVDLSTDEPYEKAFEFINSQINQLCKK